MKYAPYLRNILRIENRVCGIGAVGGYTTNSRRFLRTLSLYHHLLLSEKRSI